MEYDQFVEQVRERAGLDSPDEAVTAIQAVLGTLGELLSGKERHDLAAELPKALKGFPGIWVDRPPKELTRPHRFTLEEFYHRVAARSGSRHPAAVKRTQAVMQVLTQAVSGGELRDVFRELPAEYGALLSGAVRGPLSPSILGKPQSR
jgi:uncharacterized protein (DUF2267 family)